MQSTKPGRPQLLKLNFSNVHTYELFKTTRCFEFEFDWSFGFWFRWYFGWNGIEMDKYSYLKVVEQYLLLYYMITACWCLRLIKNCAAAKNVYTSEYRDQKLWTIFVFCLFKRNRWLLFDPTGDSATVRIRAIKSILSLGIQYWPCHSTINVNTPSLTLM